ncbi:MAG: hypothetical protein CMLOHMNK_00270 [Steroidobacteraceae bacterium]|nr:hypothetical protein [Steroidobacteraceae bacterium]
MAKGHSSGAGHRGRSGRRDAGRTKARYAREEGPAAQIAGVREGLPLARLEETAELLQVDRGRLAALLDVSMRTLQRKAEGGARLDPAASDRLARIRRIHALATHVLGEPARAARWMTAANRHLGGDAPLQLLDTDMGTQLVQQELREIEFGMPA